MAMREYDYLHDLTQKSTPFGNAFADQEANLEGGEEYDSYANA